MGHWRFRQEFEHWHGANWKNEDENIVQGQGRYFAN